MLNIISVLGPSRSGKGTIIPILAAINKFELPFSSPDLDWYVDAFHHKELSSETCSKLSANYILCYSWYSYLGRNLNVRKKDYSSVNMLKGNLDLEKKFSLDDNDAEFLDFITNNDSNEIWNTFSWELPPKIYEIIEQKYPINLNPIFCYRAPYSLFTSWVSGNRINRSKSFSRMFKYSSVQNLKRTDLKEQFLQTRNSNEMKLIDDQYIFEDLPFNELRIDKKEENELVNLIKQNNKNALYWSKRNMMVKFEAIVNQPNIFLAYIRERFKFDFESKQLSKGLKLVNQRPLENIIVMDEDLMEKNLLNMGCSKNTIDFLIREQKMYLRDLV